MCVDVSNDKRCRLVLKVDVGGECARSSRCRSHLHPRVFGLKVAPSRSTCKKVACASRVVCDVDRSSRRHSSGAGRGTARARRARRRRVVLRDPLRSTCRACSSPATGSRSRHRARGSWPSDGAGSIQYATHRRPDLRTALLQLRFAAAHRRTVSTLRARRIGVRRPQICGSAPVVVAARNCDAECRHRMAASRSGRTMPNGINFFELWSRCDCLLHRILARGWSSGCDPAGVPWRQVGSRHGTRQSVVDAVTLAIGGGYHLSWPGAVGYRRGRAGQSELVVACRRPVIADCCAMDWPPRRRPPRVRVRLGLDAEVRR